MAVWFVYEGGVTSEKERHCDVLVMLLVRFVTKDDASMSDQKGQLAGCRTKELFSTTAKIAPPSDTKAQKHTIRSK